METQRQLRERLRAECAQAGGQRPWAIQRGVSPQYVNDFLAERKEPGNKLLLALGVALVPMYRKLEKDEP
jgi:hypothetical protein